MAPTSFVSAAAAQEAAEGKKTKRLIETNSSDTLTHTWNIGDHPPTVIYAQLTSRDIHQGYTHDSSPFLYAN